MAERILALCRAMGASEDQEELLLPLIQAAQERFAARLRLGVAPEDCGPAFPLAVLSGQAEKWLAPWLADAGFHFQGVRG